MHAVPLALRTKFSIYIQILQRYADSTRDILIHKNYTQDNTNIIAFISLFWECNRALIYTVCANFSMHAVNVIKMKVCLEFVHIYTQLWPYICKAPRWKMFLLYMTSICAFDDLMCFQEFYILCVRNISEPLVNVYKQGPAQLSQYKLCTISDIGLDSRFTSLAFSGPKLLECCLENKIQHFSKHFCFK